MSILIKPLITEKTNLESKIKNCYTFLVNPKSNKIEIKNAINKFYSVTIKSIRIITSISKKKKVHFRKKNWIIGRTNKIKKAIIKLELDQVINFSNKN